MLAKTLNKLWINWIEVNKSGDTWSGFVPHLSLILGIYVGMRVHRSVLKGQRRRYRKFSKWCHKPRNCQISIPEFLPIGPLF